MTPRFSWPQYRRPWELALEAVLLDGRDGTVHVDSDHRRLRLDSVSDWSSVRLSLRLETTEQSPADIGEVTAYVLASSARTNTRVPQTLHAESARSFTGDFLLARETLAGPVQLEGHVVTSGDRVRIVGSSDPWTLVVDASDGPPLPGAPPFDMAWIDFSSHEAPHVARAAQDSYAVMDLAANKPVLLLNSEIKGFQGLLNAKKAQLERRRLRDTLATSIARYALSTLFREARAQITVEDDDTVTPPESHLLRQVCEAVAAELKSVSTVDELYLQLGRESSLTQLDRSRLWAEIDNAVDRLTNHSEMVASIVEEVRHA
jgi:hypothetical protein